MSRPTNAQTGDTQAALTFDAELLQGSFAQIPTALLRCPKVSANAIRLYGLLLSYAIDKNVVWPGQDTLCELMGISERSLRTSIGELKTLGLVTTQRGGDGKTMRYHVLKMSVKAAGNAPSENSERQETQDLRHVSQSQSGKKRQSKPAKNDGCYKEEVDKDELEAAATHTPAQEAQAAPVDASRAAAAGNPQKSVTAVAAGKPSKPAPFPDPAVLLLDWERSDLDRLSKADPGELIRRCKAQYPESRARLEKPLPAHVEFPNRYRAPVVLEILEELREKRDAPKPAPYKPPVNPPIPAAYRARHAALHGNSDTGRVVH